MSNVRIPTGVNPEALVATIRGAAHYRHREMARGERTALRGQMTQDRRSRILAAHGLEPDDWPEYRRLQTSHMLGREEAAAVIRNSRKDRP